MVRERLMDLFAGGSQSTTGETVGIELENIFVDQDGAPIGDEAVELFFETAVSRYGWQIDSTRFAGGREAVESVRDSAGAIIGKEIGSCNIEIATPPLPRKEAVACAHEYLAELYGMLKYRRHIGPIFTASRSLLPRDSSKREAEFLQLDGHAVTNMMAGTTAVQCTVDVSPSDAAACLNRLAGRLPEFMRDYPQDALWKRYITESKAGYRADRYGGPLVFESLADYCAKLAEHPVIHEGKLVDADTVSELDLHQFIKSVWWYFRLKRYGQKLCLEIRPMARRSDESLRGQIEFALESMGV